MHRKWFRQLFRRRILVIFLLVAQAAFLIHLLVRGWRISQGVKVRLIYDDIGCFFLFPQNYPQQLREFGIECVLFNPFRPFLTAKQNNRDHRKIISIDGKLPIPAGSI